eukprot:Rmarinus@m.23379
MSLSNFTNNAAGLKKLNSYLEDKSYIQGHSISTVDAAVFGAISTPIDPKELPHVARWYSHIASFALGSIPVANVPVTVCMAPCCTGPTGCAATCCGGSGKAAKPAAKDDDDDIDLFGSDSDEDSEAERAREERAQKALQAQKERNAKKKVVIGKSQIVWEVKPWDDETDLKEMERLVRTIELDGLVWGTAKLVPIGYGIKKLVIACVIEDEKIGSDDIEEKIVAFEDHVQSVDVQSFTCIQQSNQIK